MKKIIVLVVLTGLAMGIFMVSKGQKIKTIQDSRIIDAPADAVWEVIAAVDQYHHYADNNLSDVKIILGEEEGMVRQCTDHKGETWQETCTAWVPGSHYTFDVHTEAKDFNLPFRHFTGTWQVEEIDTNKSRLTMRFDYQLKHGWIMWLFEGKMRKKGYADIQRILDNWEEEILSIKKISKSYE